MENIYRSILILFTLFLISSQAYGQNELPQIGDNAPEIIIDTLLSPVGGSIPNLNKFKGKVIILEFWATWCGPCIPAMEKLNDLKNRFHDENLEIIAISDEKPQPVKRFLKNKPLDFYVVLDDNGKTSKIYQPRTFPHTVIINKKGKISAITEINNITEEIVQKLINGKDIKLPQKDYGNNFSHNETMLKQDIERKNANTLFKAVLRKAENATGRFQFGYPRRRVGVSYHRRRITARGVWPIVLFSYAFDYSNNRIVDNYGLPEEAYYLDIILPVPNEKKIREVAQNMLINGFQVSTTIREKNMDAYVLRKIPSRKVQFQRSIVDKPSYQMQGPIVRAKKQPIDRLVKYIDNFIPDKPVIDGTGLKGLYDYSLEWTYGNTKSLNQALNKLGLELVEKKTNVKILVINKI